MPKINDYLKKDTTLGLGDYGGTGTISTQPNPTDPQTNPTNPQPNPTDPQTNPSTGGTQSGSNYYNSLKDYIEGYYKNQQDKSNAYYDALKETSYKDLYNNKLAISNANEMAKKYALTALKANGYGNSGLTETTMNQNNNSYLNALNTASKNYQDYLSDINKQKLDSETTMASNQFEQTVNLMTSQHSEDKATQDSYLSQIGENMSSFTSIDDLNNYLTQKGWLVDGKFSDEILAKEGFTQTQINGIKDAYNAAKINYESNNDTTTTGKIALGESGIDTYYNKNGETTNNTGRFNNEYEKFQNDVKLGAIKADTYLKLVNGYGDYVYLYYGKDGKIYYANKEDAEKNGAKLYSSYLGDSKNAPNVDNGVSDAYLSSSYRRSNRTAPIDGAIFVWQGHTYRYTNYKWTMIK